MKAKLSLCEFGERWATLCDGRPGLRRALHLEVREPALAPLSPALSPSDGERGTDSEPSARDIRPSPVLDFIASDETLDRYQEIIVAGGWRLGNYRRNPVFQNAHQYGDVIFTLGKALITEVRAGRLFQRIEFATEANPMARIAYGLYQGKFLNAVSVGFIPLRWEDGGTKATTGTQGTWKRRFLEQELLEVSAVGIPANPNALQLGLKEGAIEKVDLQELVELLREMNQAPKVGQLLPLARALRDALKG